MATHRMPQNDDPDTRQLSRLHQSVHCGEIPFERVDMDAMIAGGQIARPALPRPVDDQHAVPPGMEMRRRWTEFLAEFGETGAN